MAVPEQRIFDMVVVWVAVELRCPAVYPLFEAGSEFTTNVLEQPLTFLVAEENVPRLLLPVVVLDP